MFPPVELQVTRVDFLPHRQALIKPPKLFIRVREIALNDEHVLFMCAKAPQGRQQGLFHGQRVLMVFCGL